MELGLALLLISGYAFGAKDSSKPIIQAVDGQGPAIIRTGQGNRLTKIVHKITEGSPVVFTAHGIEAARVEYKLSDGDRIKTGEKTSVLVKYPDGSSLIVGKASEVVIRESNPESQKVALNYGVTRVVVAKSHLLGKVKNAPHRFFINTHTAVMGARGTDFVVSAMQAQGSVSATMEVHILEGIVDVGENETRFAQGNVTPVTVGQQLSASSQGVSQPATLDRAKYIEQLKVNQPAFEKLSPPNAPLAVVPQPEVTRTRFPEAK